MKSFILEEQSNISNKPLILKDVNIKKLEADEVLVKVEACGLCHTDLHIIEGDIPLVKKPIIPGHQIIGKVIDVGKEIKDINKGMRVGIPWLHKVCGKCFFCKKGMENLCENALFTGYSVDGGYAEYVVAKRDALYEVGEEEPVIFAPILCAGVIGYRAFKKSNANESLGLYGFGSSAYLVLQIALSLNIKVFVFTRSEEHKKLALEKGAYFAGNVKDEIDVALDAGIIFAPAGEIVPHALKHIRKGGSLVLAGIHMSSIPSFPYNLIYYEKEIKTVANSTRNDVKEFIQLAKRINIKPNVEVFKFNEIPDALIKLKEGKINGSAVIQM
jgi:propanol-preferring alcohol dehydrogenase